ncbi:hypothetical protein LTR17_026984 [Elasticomyces elasticus]|nr:hypothetical protein LTR17_026984 [Elasticomyces elasticus]
MEDLYPSTGFSEDHLDTESCVTAATVGEGVVTGNTGGTTTDSEHHQLRCMNGDEREHALIARLDVVLPNQPTFLDLPGLGTPTRSMLELQAETSLKPCPPDMDLEDLAYLGAKGAMTVPAGKLLSELLTSYVQFVHPYMPIVDLEDVMGAVYSGDDTKEISLMLFQAIMFAGSAFVDLELLKNEGYINRRDARRKMFRKVKLLYNLDYDLDRISRVQTLLLMTYWVENPNDGREKEFYHWMGICLETAKLVGLNHSSVLAQVDLKARRLRERLWWSCFMRDRLISLSARKPLRIRDEDHDVPMLGLDDFEQGMLPDRYDSVLHEYAREGVRTALAQLCIQKVRLCVSIGHILTTRYTVLGNTAGQAPELTMMMMPKKMGSDANEYDDFLQCEEALDLWYHNLPQICSYGSLPAGVAVGQHGSEILLVHQAVLTMLYSTTSGALHRPQILPEAPVQPMARELQQLSARRVREAAVSIAEMAESLHSRNLVRFLPPVGVTVLMPSALISLLDMRSYGPSVHSVHFRRFLQCMRVLHKLRDTYPSADPTYFFLEAAYWKISPAHPTSPPPLGTLLNWENGKTPVLRSATMPVEPFAMHEDNISAPGLGFQTPPATDEQESQVLVSIDQSQLDQQPEGTAIVDHGFDAWADFDTWSDILLTQDTGLFDLNMEQALDFDFNQSWAGKD